MIKQEAITEAQDWLKHTKNCNIYAYARIIVKQLLKTIEHRDSKEEEKET